MAAVGPESAEMFSAKQLTDEQKAALHSWAEQGASIAELQRRLKDEFGIGITYMDARFMVLDLGISILEAKEEEGGDEVVAEGPGDGADGPADEAGPPSGGVSVTMDSIALPGALVSGKVRFSDGETAVWMLDQYGRPGLDPDTPGYRPQPEDVAEFQKQLSELMRKQGF